MVAGEMIGIVKVTIELVQNAIAGDRPRNQFDCRVIRNVERVGRQEVVNDCQLTRASGEE